MPNWIASAAPVMTLVVGWGLAQLGDERHDRRQVKREAAAAQATRQVSVDDCRSNFQRESLLSLQEEMAHLARATGRLRYEDTMLYRNEGKPWGRMPLSEEWSDKHFAATVETNKLTVRIADDELREAVGAFVSLCGDVGGANSDVHSFDLLKRAIEAHRVTTERIGILLREVH